LKVKKYARKIVISRNVDT